MTNAVGAFQRTVAQIIKEDGLVGIYQRLASPSRAEPEHFLAELKLELGLDVF